MKRFLILAVLAGCPGKDVTIYKTLGEPGAMQTCDANKQYRIDTVGADAKAARAKGTAQIRETVLTNKGCGALVVHDGTGKKLDGTFAYNADFQWCRCQ